MAVNVEMGATQICPWQQMYLSNFFWIWSIEGITFKHKVTSSPGWVGRDSR